MYTSYELQGMLDTQQKAQLVYNKGKHLGEFTDEERMAELRNNALALFAEIFEALDECGWKPWASSNHINSNPFKGEMVDAWHFFMNLMLHGDMTGQDLVEGYYEKNKRNMERQDAGYDGVTGKCPKCKRALDDVDAHQPIGPDGKPITRQWFYNDVRYCGIDCWNAARIGGELAQ